MFGKAAEAVTSQKLDCYTMALADVLHGDSIHFQRPHGLNWDSDQRNLGFRSEFGDGNNFALKASLNGDHEDGVERKIEFLHGTTTLAFKVSQRWCANISIPSSQGNRLKQGTINALERAYMFSSLFNQSVKHLFNTGLRSKFACVMSGLC